MTGHGETAMARTLPIAHLDGVLLPIGEARISPLDRGFLFGDGAYEVLPVYGGRLFALDWHLQRLANSLGVLRIRNPHDDAAWQAAMQALVAANGGGDQALYLQVTRGTDSGRDHAFPAGIAPTVFMMSSPLSPTPPEKLRDGTAVKLLDDIRWARCDVKSIALLGNVLLRQTALDAGASEALLIRDGHLVEGSVSTLFLVEGGALVTPPKSHDLLPGVTRDVLVDIARREGITAREERLPVSRLARCDEAFLCSTTREVVPITTVDGKPLASGKPGPLTLRMYDLFQQHKPRFLT
jgi:D-alanine transaminase